MNKIDILREKINYIVTKYNIFDITFMFFDSIPNEQIEKYIRENNNSIIGILSNYNNIIELEDKKELYRIFKDVCTNLGSKFYLEMEKLI